MIRFCLYLGLGTLVGLLISVLEWVTVDGVLSAVLDAPVWVQAAAPGLGLTFTAVVVRGRTSPATSDDYIRVFHSGAALPLRELVPKLLAAIGTIGSGGALGLEGPAVFAGSTLGQRVGERLRWLLGPRGGHILTVAGAAAGVAAIFRAPATGVLFALETPYQRDIARRALIPALIAASASYLAFVTIFGVDRLLPIPSGQVRLRDEVLGSLVLGVAAGGAARMLAWLWASAKQVLAERSVALRVAVGSVGAAAALLTTRGLVGESLTLGPGAEGVSAFALDPRHSVWLIAAIFGLRALVTAATLGAGGVGGVFIPLVVEGLLLGRIVEVLLDSPTPGLYPAIGLAAVLGAGYRTPLAAVMFVAETTGRAEYVIPALLATAVSQTVMGNASVSRQQVVEREGILERRLRLPVSDALLRVPVIPPEMPLVEVVDRFGAEPPAIALPVSGGSYLGLLVLRDVAAAIFERGGDATAADAMQSLPAVGHDATAIDAARLMGEHDTAVLAVVDDSGRAIGIVTALTMTGILDLDMDPDD